MDNSKVRGRLAAMTGFAGLGALVSAYQSYHFYALRSGMASFDSLCGVGQGGQASCDQVIGSAWAELVAGLPLSSFAGGWLVALGIIAWLGRAATRQRESIRIITLMSAIGFAMSVIYLYIMRVQIGGWCAFCLFIDVINTSLLALALSLLPAMRTPGAPVWRAWRNAAILALACMSLFALALKAFEAPRVEAAAVDALLSEFEAQAPIALTIPAHAPSQGPADAPVTIVEFFDYQCPACRVGSGLMRAVVSRFPKQVRVVYRNYPLDPACNTDIKSAGHAAACEAARVALCANEQGRFKEFFGRAFDRQSELARGKIVALAESVGVDGTRLQSCLASEVTASALQRDIEDARRVAIRATPTFFVNGRKIEGLYPIEVWEMIIARVLKAATPPTTPSSPAASPGVSGAEGQAGS